jgi:hypothetical protein
MFYFCRIHMKVPQNTFLETKILPYEEQRQRKVDFLIEPPSVLYIASSVSLTLVILSVYPFISIKNNRLDISSPGCADLKHGISSAGINSLLCLQRAITMPKF